MILVLPRTFWVGSPDPHQPPPPKNEQLFAFALVDTKARVFRFPDTPEGREELAALARSGLMLCAVHGTEAICTNESMTKVRTPYATHQSSDALNWAADSRYPDPKGGPGSTG